MKIIKTTKKQRDLYAKHLNKLEDYANGNFEDGACYMCRADSLGEGGCRACPINIYGEWCAGGTRKRNLRTRAGKNTRSYKCATPESIRKHARWIEKQIVDRTDCEFAEVEG